MHAAQAYELSPPPRGYSPHVRPGLRSRFARPPGPGVIGGNHYNHLRWVAMERKHREGIYSAVRTVTWDLIPDIRLLI